MRIIILILTISFFAHGVESSKNNRTQSSILSDKKDSSTSTQNTSSLSSTKKKTKKYQLPDTNVNKDKARGVIIAFHNWPNESEKTLILQETTKANLTKKKEYERFKMWVFEWQELKNISLAKKVCDSLSKVVSIKYCEADTLVSPDRTKCKQRIPVSSNVTVKGVSQYTNRSEYWAQEMIGSDLLHEAIMKNKKKPYKENLVTAIDVKSFFHGKIVGKLISDSGSKHSVLPSSKIDVNIEYLSPVSPYDDYDDIDRTTNADILAITDRLLDEVEDKCSESSDDDRSACEALNLPSFINMSLSWNGYAVGDTLRRLSPPSVLVVAAGNHHPKRPVNNNKVRMSRQYDAIIVGSLSPTGEKSDFSQEHEEVHIMAPSDNYLNAGPGFRNFSGTSGATPLVTGSLAGFEWLSGYHPTAEESKILLEKTAILTQYSNDNPRKNGAGMLNSYKLGMMGKKLKELCGSDKSCFAEKIRDDSIYEFPEDPGLPEAVAETFPECGGNTCRSENSMSCNRSKRESIFNRLRKAAFLNPSNEQLWKSIACVYKLSGYTENVKGTLSFYKALFGPTDTSYTRCSSNSDCTLVSSCTEGAPFSAVTLPVSAIYNIEQCESPNLCNGKCTCENPESTTNSEGQKVQYSSVCENFQCATRTNNTEITLEDKNPPQNAQYSECQRQAEAFNKCVDDCYTCQGSCTSNEDHRKNNNITCSEELAEKTLCTAGEEVPCVPAVASTLKELSKTNSAIPQCRTGQRTITCTESMARQPLCTKDEVINIINPVTRWACRTYKHTQCMTKIEGLPEGKAGNCHLACARTGLYGHAEEDTRSSIYPKAKECSTGEGGSRGVR